MSNSREIVFLASIYDSQLWFVTISGEANVVRNVFTDKPIEAGKQLNFIDLMYKRKRERNIYLVKGLSKCMWKRRAQIVVCLNSWLEMTSDPAEPGMKEIWDHFCGSFSSHLKYKG